MPKTSQAPFTILPGCKENLTGWQVGVNSGGANWAARGTSTANAVPRRRAATGSAAAGGRCGSAGEYRYRQTAPHGRHGPTMLPYNLPHPLMQPATHAGHLKSVHRWRQRFHLSRCRARMKPCGGRWHSSQGGFAATSLLQPSAAPSGRLGAASRCLQRSFYCNLWIWLQGNQV